MSDLPTRKAPVIMMASEPSEAVVRAARDAGVHEFLRKPFKVRDLTVRVEAVTQHDRRWIEAINYVGPDRRRFNSADYQGPLQRHREGAGMTDDEMRISESLKIMQSALQVIDTNPRQALRALQAQADELASAAARREDHVLASSALQLKGYLDRAARNGVVSRKELAYHASAMRPGALA